MVNPIWLQGGTETKITPIFNGFLVFDYMHPAKAGCGGGPYSDFCRPPLDFVGNGKTREMIVTAFMAVSPNPCLSAVCLGKIVPKV